MSLENSADGKPDNPQEQREKWDDITRGAEERLKAENVAREEKAKEEKEVRMRQEKDFLEEVKQARKRSEGREVWRREQHAKREEMEKQKRAEDAERKILADIQLKKEQKEKTQQESMAALHKRAVEKNRNTKMLNARVEEEKQKKQATRMEDLNVGRIDQAAQDKITHIERDAKKTKDMLKVNTERKRIEAEELFKDKKKEAQARSRDLLRTAKDEQSKRAIRLDENQSIARADAERKRVLFGLDEAVQQGMMEADTLAKRLVDEVKREETQRAQRAHTEAENRRKEAEARRERTEEWFEKGQEKKKDL